jgi:hypothetical protein
MNKIRTRDSLTIEGITPRQYHKAITHLRKVSEGEQVMQGYIIYYLKNGGSVEARPQNTNLTLYDAGTDVTAYLQDLTKFPRIPQ